MQSAASAARAAGMTVAELYRDDNRGVAATRAAAVDLATGEYTAWLDADDALEPDAISKLANATEEGRVDVVTASYAAINGRRQKTMRYPADPSFDLNSLPINTQYFALWNKLVRTSLLRAEPGFEPGLDCWEDLGQLSRIFALKPSIKAIPDVVARYTDASGSGSLTHTRKERILRQHLAVARSVEAWMQRRGIAAEYEPFLIYLKFAAKVKYLRSPLLLRHPWQRVRAWRRSFPEVNRRIMGLRHVPLRFRFLFSLFGL